MMKFFYILPVAVLAVKTKTFHEGAEDDMNDVADTIVHIDEGANNLQTFASEYLAGAVGFIQGHDSDSESSDTDSESADTESSDDSDSTHTSTCDDSSTESCSTESSDDCDSTQTCDSDSTAYESFLHEAEMEAGGGEMHYLHGHDYSMEEYDNEFVMLEVDSIEMGAEILVYELLVEDGDDVEAELVMSMGQSLEGSNMRFDHQTSESNYVSEEGLTTLDVISGEASYSEVSELSEENMAYVAGVIWRLLEETTDGEFKHLHDAYEFIVAEFEDAVVHFEDACQYFLFSEYDDCNEYEWEHTHGWTLCDLCCEKDDNWDFCYYGEY